MCVWIPMCQVSSHWIFLIHIQINNNTSTSTIAAVAFKCSQNNGEVCEFIIIHMYYFVRKKTPCKIALRIYYNSAYQMCFFDTGIYTHLPYLSN